MMRIAIVVESFPVVSETFITNKVLHLCSRGHHVTVVTHRKANNAALVQLYGLNKIENLTINDPVIPATSMQWLKLVLTKPAIFFGASKAKSLKQRTRENLLSTGLTSQKFDIIHFEFSALAILYKDVLPSIAAATVVSCRGTAEKVKPLTIPGRKEQLAEVFSRVDAIHCVSADMARTIEPHCSQPQRVFVNRPSVDVNYFTRSKPYQNSGVLTIVSVGRFTFQKGYLIGLLAVKKLKEQQVSFTWKIVGDGPQLEEVIFHIHALGLQNEVTLLGKQNKAEILELYNTAGILLLPSVYEGIANVVLEAMAMEIPVVSTRSGGLDEVIEHGTNGLLANIYDHESLSNHLLELANDFERRKAIGQSARKTVVERFTIQRQVNEFEEKYLSLTNRKGSAT